MSSSAMPLMMLTGLRNSCTTPAVSSPSAASPASRKRLSSRLRRKATYHRNRPGRGQVLQHLGPLGRIATYSGLGLLVTVSLVIPITVLVAWVVRGMGSGQALGDVWVDAARSLGVSLAAAVAAAKAQPAAARGWHAVLPGRG